MFCTNCGTELNSTGTFCSSCGVKVSNIDTEKIDTPNEPVDEKKIVENIIGKNADYYLGKWSKSPRPARKRSWNWAAFWGTFFWMGYRKMYKLSIITIISSMIMLIILSFMGTVSNTIGYSISLVFGFYGNAWYYTHVKQLQVKHMNNPSKYPIDKIGGTSWVGGFLVTGLFILSLIIVGSIFG